MLRLLYHRVKRHRYPLDRLDGPQSQSGCCGKDHIFSLPGIEPLTSNPQPVLLVTGLSWLQRDEVSNIIFIYEGTSILHGQRWKLHERQSGYRRPLHHHTLVTFIKPYYCYVYMSFVPSVCSSTENPPRDFTVTMTRLIWRGKADRTVAVVTFLYETAMSDKGSPSRIWVRCCANYIHRERELVHCFVLLCILQLNWFFGTTRGGYLWTGYIWIYPSTEQDG
jgi:hypothetical protein